MGWKEAVALPGQRAQRKGVAIGAEGMAGCSVYFMHALLSATPNVEVVVIGRDSESMSKKDLRTHRYLPDLPALTSGLQGLCLDKLRCLTLKNIVTTPAVLGTMAAPSLEVVDVDLCDRNVRLDTSLNDDQVLEEAAKHFEGFVTLLARDVPSPGTGFLGYRKPSNLHLSSYSKTNFTRYYGYVLVRASVAPPSLVATSGAGI